MSKQNSGKKPQKQSIWANVNKKGSVVSGRNVYVDRKGQRILYVPSRRCGYIVREKDENGFVLYHNRLAIVIAVFMIGLSFNLNWMTIGLISIVFYCLLEWRYRSHYLPSMTCITNFKPEQQHTRIESLVEEHNLPRTILLAVLYLALGILMVINGYQMKAQLWMLIGDYGVLAFCIYFSSQYFIAAWRMSRN